MTITTLDIETNLHWTDFQELNVDWGMKEEYIRRAIAYAIAKKLVDEDLISPILAECQTDLDNIKLKTTIKIVQE